MVEVKPRPEPFLQKVRWGGEEEEEEEFAFRVYDAMEQVVGAIELRFPLQYDFLIEKQYPRYTNYLHSRFFYRATTY